MGLAELTLIASMSINHGIDFKQIEDAYWHCDTAYMSNKMTGAVFAPCLKITDMFQSTFYNKEEFTKYHEHKSKAQWAKRGYTE